MKKMVVRCDISDWHDETVQTEENVMTLDDLVTLAVEKGYTSAQLARMHIVQRELGLVEGDVLPENKQLLQSGGTSSVNYAFARAKKEIELHGKRYGVRMLVAPITKDGDGDDDDNGEPPDVPTTWQTLGSDGARELAEMYLDRLIPGHVMGRLLIIRECGGNVRSAANALQDKIEQMVVDLT